MNEVILKILEISKSKTYTTDFVEDRANRIALHLEEYNKKEIDLETLEILLGGYLNVDNAKICADEMKAIRQINEIVNVAIKISKSCL